MVQPAKSPYYQKLSLTLISLGILALLVFYGKGIILPILFAVLIAMLLLPFTNFLARKKFPKVLSILIPLVLSFLLIGGIVYLLSRQIIHFADDLPTLKKRILELGSSLQGWLDESLNISVPKQNQYIKDTVQDIKEQGPKLVGITFLSVTEMLAYVVLLPIYTFLMLFYRTTIKTFFITAFKNGSEDRVREVLSESGTVAQQYVTGLLIETTIVFTLNTIGFLILGIKYAVFLALLAALLNLIPYVGMLLANIISIIVTLVSSENITDALWVGVILAVVQFIDNNFGMPLIVGNKVRINALVTIVGVLVGGALCGVPGMFLAIPALAVLKVIFDKVPDLQAWAILIGDETEESSTKKPGFTFSKIKNKSKTVKV